MNNSVRGERKSPIAIRAPVLRIPYREYRTDPIGWHLDRTLIRLMRRGRSMVIINTQAVTCKDNTGYFHNYETIPRSTKRTYVAVAFVAIASALLTGH